MSSSKLKPKLNPEILYGILQEFGDGKEETSEELIKFMLAGRESCRAFLDYFSKATRVNFRVQTLEIVVMNKTHCFGYDWEFLNIILKAAIPSINHLAIYECPGSESGFEILDRFLKPDLKCLTLFAAVPSRYMDFFKDNCNFETVHSQHLHPHNASVLDVFKIPSEEHKVLFASYMDYIRAVPFLSDRHSIADAGFDNSMKFVPNKTYPAVKKLVLVPCNHSLGFTYSLASEVLLFPSLQYFEAEFLSEGPWRNSIDDFLALSSLSVSPAVKANISFVVYDGNGRLEEVLHLKETNPEIIFNESDATISKTYKLQDGYFVHFVIQFGGNDLVTNNNVVADGQNNVVANGQNNVVANGQNNVIPNGQNNVIPNVQDYVANVAIFILNTIQPPWFALPDTVRHYLSCFLNAAFEIMVLWLVNWIFAYFFSRYPFPNTNYFVSIFIVIFSYQLRN